MFQGIIAEEQCVLSEQESEEIINDDAKDVKIEDFKKLSLEDHLDTILSTEVAEHQGAETRTVWSGQEWKKYV